MSDGIRHELAERTLAALQWNYAGALARAVCQITIMIVLARLLGPEPFGLVAIAWLLIGVGTLISDFGFGAALVQRAAISPDEVRYVFTVQMLLGVGYTVLVAGSADLLAYFFEQPELVPVVRALSFVFLVQAFGQTAVNLLRRDLDFKGLQLSQVLSYVLAFVLLGIPLAYLGLGVWSLIIAQLTQFLLYAVLAYLRVRHPIKPLLARRPAGLFNFGYKVMAVNILNHAIRDMDSAFVGGFFGVVSLGLYNRAYTLMTTPMTNFVSVLQGVLFPAYSRLQEEDDTLKLGYLATLGVVTLVSLPVFASVALVPRTVIEGLYGSQWLGAVPLLVPLALAMPFGAVTGIAGPLIWGKGQVGRELRVETVVAMLFVVVLLATSKVSLVALACGVFGVYVLRAFLMTSAALLVLGGTWREVINAVRGSFLVLAGATLAVLGVDQLLGSYDTAPFVRLLGDMLAGSAGALAMLTAFPRLVFSGEVIWALTRVGHKLPPVLRHALKRAQPKGGGGSSGQV